MLERSRRSDFCRALSIMGVNLTGGQKPQRQMLSLEDICQKILILETRKCFIGPQAPLSLAQRYVLNTLTEFKEESGVACNLSSRPGTGGLLVYLTEAWKKRMLL